MYPAFENTSTFPNARLLRHLENVRMRFTEAVKRPQVKALLKQGNVHLRTQAHESHCSATILEQKSNVTRV